MTKNNTNQPSQPRVTFNTLLSILLTITMLFNSIPTQGMAYAADLINNTNEEQPAIEEEKQDTNPSETNTNQDTQTVTDKQPTTGEQPIVEEEKQQPEKTNPELTQEPEPEIKTVQFIFDSNNPDINNVTIEGEMPSITVTINDEIFMLPKNVFTCENHDFISWSLTPDGKDIQDDPSTPDVNEYFAALNIPDEISISNLTYIEHTDTNDINHDLHYAIRDNTITLYAQWKEKETVTNDKTKLEQNEEQKESSEEKSDDNTIEQNNTVTNQNNEQTTNTTDENLTTDNTDNNQKQEPKSDKNTDSDINKTEENTPEPDVNNNESKDNNSLDKSESEENTSNNKKDSPSDDNKELQQNNDDQQSNNKTNPDKSLIDDLKSNQNTNNTKSNNENPLNADLQNLRAPKSNTRSLTGYTITFDAGNGTFEGGTTTNSIEYVPSTGTVTKVSHTPNIDDEGNKLSNYEGNLNINDIITIEGSSELNIHIWYGGESTNYDWACIWEGSHPEYTATSNYSSALSPQKLGGNSSQTADYTISGDTVTFGFKSDYGGYGIGIGYYATITGTGEIYNQNGTYQTPTTTNNLRFTGWENANGELIEDWQSLTETTTLYARYDDNYVSFSANSGEGIMSDLPITEGITAPNCTFTAPSGQIFSCWNTQSDGLGTDYLPGNPLPYTNGDYTLYAQYTTPKAYAVLENDGDLIFCKASPKTPTKPNTTIIDINNNTYTGTTYTDFETSNYSLQTAVPWYNERTNIKNIRFAQTISPQATNYWFYGCNNLETINFNNFNTTNLRFTQYMFYGCSNPTFNPDFSTWNTRQLVNATNMFYGCSGNAFNPDVSNWNTSSLIHMASMFEQCHGSSFNPDVTNWNTSNFVTINRMFASCYGSSFNPDVSNWNTSKVTDIQGLFASCYGSSFNPDVSNWDVSKITDMREVFRNCYGNAFNPDVSHWDVSHVTDIRYLFYNCHGNTFDPDVSNWNVSNIIDMRSMFYNCYGAAFNPDVSQWNTEYVTNMSYMFYSCNGSSFSPDISRWNISNVTDMSYMFAYCSGNAFTSIDISKWDIFKVTNVSYMFAYDSKLTTIYAASNTDWNTNSIISTSTNMFYNCTHLIGGNNTQYNSSIVDKTYARTDNFNNNQGYFTKKDDTPQIFEHHYAILDSNGNMTIFKSTNLYTANTNQTVTDIDGNSYIGRIWPTSENTRYDSSGQTPWYSYKNSIKTISFAQEFKPISLAYWCYENKYLTTFDSTNLNTSNVTNLNHTFYNCSSLANVDVTNWNTSNVTNMASMFGNCYDSNFNPDVSHWDVSNVTDMGYMFYGCHGNSFNPNMNQWNTSNVTDMTQMFRNCYGNNFNPNLANWDVSKVTDMRYLFYSCYGANFSPILTNWNIASATNLNCMFEYCYGDNFNPDVSNWNTSNVTNMSEMFRECYGNSFNPDMSNWDVSNVTTTYFMFYNCHGTNFAPDLSNWYTPNISNISYTFKDCTNITELNLSQFDCSRINTIYEFFPPNLTKITLGEKFQFKNTKLPGNTEPNSQSTNKWMNITTNGNAISSQELANNYDGNQTTGDYARGTYIQQERGYTYAVITDNGDLVFFNSHHNPDTIENGTSNQTITDITGTTWSGTIYKNVENGRSWSSLPNANNIKNVYVAQESIYAPQSLTYAFAGLQNLENINFNNFDTHAVTDMTGTFTSCPKLQTVSLSGLDTSHVTKMDSLFAGCTKLTTINLSGIDTSKVTNMNSIFNYCTKLSNITGIETINTYKLETMNSAFFYCRALTEINLSTWDTTNLTNISSAFYDGPKHINISGWNAPKLSSTQLSSAFAGNYTTETVNASNMKIGQSLSSTNSFNLGGSKIKTIDLSGTTFYDAKSFSISDNNYLTTLNLSGLTLPKTNSFNIPANSALTTVNLMNLSIPTATSLQYAFSYCTELKNVDMSTINAPMIKNIDTMFRECSKLTFVDLSGLKNSPIETAQQTFTRCTSLQSLDLTDLDTSNITNMNAMFNDCNSLKTLDISTWNTSNVTDMNNIFHACTSLQRLSLGENFIFTGEDSLPVQEWKNINTNNTVNDLWNDYDGTTMAGTYTRAVTTIETNDVYNTEDIDDITYDPTTQEIIIYLKVQENATPASITIPALRNYLKIHPNIIKKNPTLKTLLDNIINETEPLPNLKLSVKPIAYTDISACSYADKLIFTFDTPKTGIGPVHMDLYHAALGSSNYTYAGYIERSNDDPTIFLQYNNQGNLIDTLQPNTQHTKAQVYNINPEEYPSYNVPMLPEYPEYDTYNSTMDNYEALVEPGRYKIIFSTPDTINIPITNITTQSEITNPYYKFNITADSEPEWLTLFNAINTKTYDIIVPGNASISNFRKVSATNSEHGVANAIYKFTGLTSGDIAYGKTNQYGYISPVGTAIASESADYFWPTSEPPYYTYISMDNELYTTLNNDNTLSNPYKPKVNETYRVEEIKAPDNYYTNEETTTVTFISGITHPYVSGQATSIQRDGVTTTADDSINNKHKCLTCTDECMCMCKLYGQDTCEHCGIPTASVNITSTDAIHSDQPYPKIGVRKVDNLNQAVNGATLQILYNGQIIEEWTSQANDNGNYHHYFTFPETGDYGIPYGEQNKQFILHEVSTPGKGYLSSNDIPFTISYDTGIAEIYMTDPLSIDITVNKQWSPYIPNNATATLALIADGVVTDNVITLDGTVDNNGETSPWVATFEDMPKYNGNTNTEIAYTVVETNATNDWHPRNNTPAQNGDTIINIYDTDLPQAGQEGINNNNVLYLTAITGAITVITLRHKRRKKISPPTLPQ